MADLTPIGMRIPTSTEPSDEDPEALPETLVFDWWAWYSEPQPGRGAMSDGDDDDNGGGGGGGTPPGEIIEDGMTTLIYGLDGQFNPVGLGLTEVEVLVVGSGGGGGWSHTLGEPAGGGGGGGVRHVTVDVSGVTEPIPITVGFGVFSRGVPSSFGDIVAEGGGHGGLRHPDGLENGASGGGEYSGQTSSRGLSIYPGGHDGGRKGNAPLHGGAGGGGGAGGAGGDGWSPRDPPYYVVAGRGGEGYVSNITGTNVAYGAGGGAAWHPRYPSSGGDPTGAYSGGGAGAKLILDPESGAVSGIEAQDGEPGTGGGGGGGCRLEHEGVQYGNPGVSGSGVVVVRFPTPTP